LHQFIDDPLPLLPILEKLKDDPEDYVYRSVANNLNDIAKDHPDLVIQVCRSWKQLPPNETRDWTVKHALRSLIKSGHPDVFGLLGYTDKPKVNVEHLMVNNAEATLVLGDSLDFSFTLVSNGRGEQNVVIDYVIYHMKSNGKQTPKVFKLKVQVLKAGASVTIHKKHPMKKVTTRTYYDGEHRVAILVNGIERESKPYHFSLGGTPQ